MVVVVPSSPKGHVANVGFCITCKSQCSLPLENVPAPSLKKQSTCIRRVQNMLWETREHDILSNFQAKN